MRHFIDGASCAGQVPRTSPCAPARAARGVLESTAPTALVAPRGLLPSLMAARERARPAAIQLTVVAVGPQQHLIAATRAQEQASAAGTCPSSAIKPKVLDGFAQEVQHCCCTAFMARCRVRRGLRCQALATAAVPTYFGIVAPCTAHLLHMSPAAYSRRSTGPPTAPGITARSMTPRLRLPSRPRAGQAGQPHTRSFGINKPSLGLGTPQTESDTSPSSGGGSQPAFTVGDVAAPDPVWRLVVEVPGQQIRRDRQLVSAVGRHDELPFAAGLDAVRLHEALHAVLTHTDAARKQLLPHPGPAVLVPDLAWITRMCASKASLLTRPAPGRLGLSERLRRRCSK